MNLIANGKKNGYDLYCMIKTISEKTNVKGDQYLDITFSDSDGEMNAKLWNYSAAEHGSYEVGDIVKVRGEVTQYNGKDQMRVDKIRLVAETDDFDYSTVVLTSEYPGEAMMKEIYSVINAVKDEDLKTLTLALLKDAEEKMLYWPAAFRLHHAMRGGLLYHTLSILRLAQSVSALYPSVDKDMLYCGCVLHDICKIDEFDVNNLGIVKSYSPKGELVGHLVMGAMKIAEKAKELNIPEDKSMLLEHMIISHHGTPEFGAAVRPMTLEAIVLSELDNLDATIYEVEAAVKSVKPNEFTDRMWALDNRKLFNHGRTDVSTKANLI